MTSTNDGKDVKSNQTSAPKGKTYYIELYKSLESRLSGEWPLRTRTVHLGEAWRRVHSLCLHSAPSTHPHLLIWLQRHTAKTVLQTEWQSPTSKNEHTTLEEAIDVFIEEGQAAIAARTGVSPGWETQLLQRAEWFKKILSNPWGHPVLRVLLDPRGTPPTDDEILEWLKEERGVMFVTRLRQLAASKCDDLAMLLTTAVMAKVRAETPIVMDADQCEEPKDKPPPENSKPTFADILKTEAGFTVDVWELITDIEFVLLYKRDRHSSCIDLAKQTPLRNGYQLVERLQSRLETSPREKKLWKNAKEVAALITQVIITRCMVMPVCSSVCRSALYCCTRSLVKLAARGALPAAAAALAAPAATARHLHTLALAVDAQSTDEMKPFVCELYVRAITAGMNELEKLKIDADKQPDARLAEQTLSAWFTQLGGLLAASDRINCECTLTAFSVHPSPAMYERIKIAPSLPPVVIDALEPKIEGTNSEYGSWASDSRSQTNFVKTSETLNLKQTQFQANVLSTALLTEGERLGLGPVVCQDIAVLLSGPRVKTLSWDMDRELLLENCRAHMERTHGGTRALTTELKYLNLDPAHFQHLPEEDEDDTDIYYGIEKGYEHLVEFQEPEEIWQDALIDPELTETACSSSMESDSNVPVRRKKNVFKIESSEEESDPLSLVAEAKRAEEKKERPHSKERSRDRKSSKSREITDKPKKEHSRERRKETDKKDKKKDKKERKKRKRDNNEMCDPLMVSSDMPKAFSLSSLIGMKVSNMKSRQTNLFDEVARAGLSITDSDNDSQGKISLQSLNSEGNDSNVLFDGLYSMDDLKSPEKSSQLANHIHDHKSPASRKLPGTLNKHGLNRVPATPDFYVSNKTTVNEEVKQSLTKLIHFRQQRQALESAMKESKSSMTSRSPMQYNGLWNSMAKQTYRSPKAIINQEIPFQSQISPKVVTIPEIPKMYIDKKQVDQPNELRDEDKYFLLNASKESNNVKPPETPTCSNIHPTSMTYPDKIKDMKMQPNICTIQKQQNPVNSVTEVEKKDDYSEPGIVSDAINMFAKFDTPGQKRFQDFLKELQESINAGAGVDKSKVSAKPTSTRKERKPMSRVKPIILNKAETKTSQSAKQLVQQKKVENSLNTFSRLSYMHKNKLTDNKIKQEINTDHQDPLQQRIGTTEIDRMLADHKHANLKYLQTKSDLVISRVGTPPVGTSKAIDKTSINKMVKPRSSPVCKENPVLSDLLQCQIKHLQIERNNCPPAPIPAHTSGLVETDQDDLRLLLRQQGKLNTSRIPPKTDHSNKTVHNVQLLQTTTKRHITSTNHTTPYTKTPTSKLITTPQIKNVAIENSVPIPTVTNCIKPTIISQNDDLKATQQQPLNMTKPVTYREDSGPKNYSIKPKQEAAFIKASEEKSTTNEDKQTDWEKVMNAILAHKTPSRGPNALEMALKNDGFKGSYTNTSLRNQRIVRTKSTGELNLKDKVTDVIKYNDKYLLKSKSKLAHDNSSSILNIKHLDKSLQISKKKIAQDPSCSNLNVSNEKKPNSSKSKTKLAHDALSSNTNVPSVSKRETDKATVLCKSKPREKSKVIKQVNTPSLASTSTPNITKALHLETPNKISKKTSQKESHAKLSSAISGNHVTPDNRKRQFTCSLPKEDDPFISGIQNSDYDLLEELMDDDLRQEIGELSSDEETYVTRLDSQKDFKTSVVGKSGTNDINKSYHIALIEDKIRLVETTHIPKAQQKSNMRNTEVLSQPIDIINPDNLLNKPCVQPPNVIRNLASNIVLTPKNDTKQYFNTINDNVTNVCNSQVLDTSNVFMTAVPQQTSLQNVVIIGSELIYDPFTQIPAPVQPPVNSISQNTYMAFNNSPNMDLFNSTQFAAPAVNPLIIGNAITMPVATNIAASTIIDNTMQSQLLTDDITLQDTFHSDVNKVNLEIPFNPTIEQHIDNNYTSVENKLALDVNYNKNIERKVLSQVQEKQNVSLERNDTKNRRLSIDNDNLKKLTLTDQERLKKKRMAIINREISHRCGTKPIPLAYEPLKPRVVCAVDKSLPNPIKDTDTQDGNKTDLQHDIIENHNDTQNKEIICSANLNCNENCKENKSTSKPTRRILLRSSNKLRPKLNSSPDFSKNHVGRKTKVRLKVDIPLKDKPAEVICEETKSEVANVVTPKRNSKRPLTKKLTKDKDGEKKVAKFRCKRNKVPEKSKERSKLKNRCKLPKIDTPNAQQIDIEDELLGSKIPKMTAQTILTDNENEAEEFGTVSETRVKQESPISKTVTIICTEAKVTETISDIDKCQPKIVNGHNNERKLETNPNKTTAVKLAKAHDNQSDANANKTIPKSKSHTKTIKKCLDKKIVDSSKAHISKKEIKPTEEQKPMKRKWLTINKSASSKPENEIALNIKSSKIMDTELLNKNENPRSNASPNTLSSECNDLIILDHDENTSVMLKKQLKEVHDGNTKSPEIVSINEAAVPTCVPTSTSGLSLNNIVTDRQENGKKKRMIGPTQPIHATTFDKQQAMPIPDNSTIKISDHKSSTKTTKHVHSSKDKGIMDCIPQSLKDSIVIEPLENEVTNDPFKKCVRVRLPTGRAFKATVHGAMPVNFDSLFADPAIKSVLLNTLNYKRKYTLNIKQVTTSDKLNPSKILETHFQGLNVRTKHSTNDIETVNLLSDDEGEDLYQSIKTEFGNYKILSMDKNVFTQHQNKFNQKCCVEILRKITTQSCGSKETDNPNLNSIVKSNFESASESVNIENNNDLIVVDDEAINIENTTIIPDLKCNEVIDNVEGDHSDIQLDDIIEIDDSSNDSVVVFPSINDVPKVAILEPELTINQLRDLVIQDFGLAEVLKPTLSNNSITVPTGDSETIEMCPTFPEEISKCVVKMTKCDDLIKKYDFLKIMNRKCVVELVRCDDFVQDISMKQTDNQIQSVVEVQNAADHNALKHEQENIEINLESGILSPNTKSLSRSGSYSILDDFTLFNDIDAILDLENERDRSSPVMEVFDIIAALGNKLTDASEEPNMKVLTPTESHISCDSEFVIIKRSLSQNQKAINNDKLGHRHEVISDENISHFKEIGSLTDIREGNIMSATNQENNMLCVSEWLISKRDLSQNYKSMITQTEFMTVEDSFFNDVSIITKYNRLSNPQINISCESEWFSTKRSIIQNYKTIINDTIDNQNKMMIDDDNLLSTNVSPHNNAGCDIINQNLNLSCESEWLITKRELSQSHETLNTTRFTPNKRSFNEDNLLSTNSYNFTECDIMKQNFSSPCESEWLISKRELSQNHETLNATRFTPNKRSFNEDNLFSTNSSNFSGCDIMKQNFSSPCESEWLISKRELSQNLKTITNAMRLAPSKIFINKDNRLSREVSNATDFDIMDQDRFITPTCSISCQSEWLISKRKISKNQKTITYERIENKMVGAVDNILSKDLTAISIINKNTSKDEVVNGDPRPLKICVPSLFATVTKFLLDNPTLIYKLKPLNKRKIAYDCNTAAFKISKMSEKYTDENEKKRVRTSDSKDSIKKLNRIKSIELINGKGNKNCNNFGPVEFPTQECYMNEMGDHNYTKSVFKSNTVTINKTEKQFQGNTAQDHEENGNKRTEKILNDDIIKEETTDMVSGLLVEANVLNQNVCNSANEDNLKTEHSVMENARNRNKISGNDNIGESDLIVLPEDVFGDIYARRALSISSMHRDPRIESVVNMDNHGYDKESESEDLLNGGYEKETNQCTDEEVETTQNLGTYAFDIEITVTSGDDIESKQDKHKAAADKDRNIDYSHETTDDKHAIVLDHEYSVKYALEHQNIDDTTVNKDNYGTNEGSNCKSKCTNGVEGVLGKEEQLITKDDSGRTVKNILMTEEVASNSSFYDNKAKNIFHESEPNSSQSLNKPETNIILAFETSTKNEESNEIRKCSMENISNTNDCNNTSNMAEPIVNVYNSSMDLKGITTKDDGICLRDDSKNTKHSIEKRKLSERHLESSSDKNIPLISKNISSFDLKGFSNDDGDIKVSSNNPKNTIDLDETDKNNITLKCDRLNMQLIDQHSDVHKKLEQNNKVSEYRFLQSDPDMKVSQECPKNICYKTQSNPTQPNSNFNETTDDEQLHESISVEKQITLIYKDNSEIVLKGIEYEVPKVGTCYMFPLMQGPYDSRENNDINTQKSTNVTLGIDNGNAIEDESYFKVIVPKVTYSKKLRESPILYPKYTKKWGKNNFKRKIDMSDVKIAEKRYRKGKNIDHTKGYVAGVNDPTYSKEYRSLFEYNSSLKFSYSRPFRKEHIDVQDLLTAWPIKGPCAVETENDIDIDRNLFDETELIDKPKAFQDPMHLTLVEELAVEYKEPLLASDINETNFSMGFGEGSGRVIQNLEDGGDISKFSAATLSDVKQSQPLLLSENCNVSSNDFCEPNTKEDQLRTLKRYINNISVKDKVRSYFKTSSTYLNNDWIRAQGKGYVDNNHNGYDASKFPFGLTSPVFIHPAPVEVIAQVVQVGQLSVSAAQNPVICDPRVTQVSNASPSQCSADIGLQDDSQSAIQNEYTELTTADLRLPMQEYIQHNQLIHMEEPLNLQMNVENIPIETEIKSDVKIELMEQVSEDKEDQTECFEMHEQEQEPLTNNHIVNINNTDYSYDTNNTSSSSESDSNMQIMFSPTENPSLPESVPESIPESVPEYVPESVAESVSESVPESVPENIPESVPEYVPESVAETVPENVAETVPERVPESIPESIPESVPEPYSYQEQNGLSEKMDQITMAMNCAGIPTSDTSPNERAQALVNLISQKIRQDAVGTTQAPTNNYSKTTSINAMALQQALAQILPPPLNQTNTENNQHTTSNPAAPQVLHIVQGKNAPGNQITLLDNAQQSVITTQNSTPVLHIVQNKGASSGPTSNGTPATQPSSFGGLSLVDTGLQQGGNQLLHIVNTGSQKNNASGQLLKRVNLLTNLTNAQGSNEQKMVQFVCKSADGKAIQLNAAHQRSMVLRLQPIESPNIQTTPKSVDSQVLTPPSNSMPSQETLASQQEIKSRSIYEENYAKFIQNSSTKPSVPEKCTSLPKFNQAFGKQVFQDISQKQNEMSNGHSHLSPVNTNLEHNECQPSDNTISLDHMSHLSSPPLLLRKSPAQTTQPQPNLVQQIKQTLGPMNIQTMHGGVIYTRQIPVNIGGGQTINLITVPSTDLLEDSTQKQQSDLKFVNHNETEPSIIKLVPQSQRAENGDVSAKENTSQIPKDNNHNPHPHPHPVLTQMRIKLPMLSKNPQMVTGARVVRPSFFQIQRNVIGGANQPVYQQLVLTAAPPIGQQTIRLPQTQPSRQVKVPPESQSSSESQMSSSTLEQLREFDLVLEQVKERSTVQPNSTSNSGFPKLNTPSTDTIDSPASVISTPKEITQQVLYSIGNNHPLNVAFVNRKATATTSTYRSPDSSGIADSPSSSTPARIPHTVTTEASSSETRTPPKPARVGSKSKSRHKSSSHSSNSVKINSIPPKTSSHKPLEDEQTTQRILYILAEYKEQVENSPDKDKPAPRRRTNTGSLPGSSKRKKSSSSSRRSDMSPVFGDETCRTMGSEDSSCGTSQGDCNESCVDSHSPQDSPRKVVRKLTFEQETPILQPRPLPHRNIIVADGQTITVARGTAGKPTTAVLMPANYLLPVSMVKGGQQIAIVTNRGPKLLTVGGEGGATNALLLQRLIGPGGLKPVLTRPGVRHVRLPAAALHNLQAFNLATATGVHPPDSTASASAPPGLIDTRVSSSPWADREDLRPDRGSSPEGSEPWNLASTAHRHEYHYEETVRTESLNRTVLVVHKKDGSSHRHHRLTHVSSAALRHKYAILEHELRLQKSLSEECEDLGVDSPSASDLFPEAELLFSGSPAHDHTQDHGHHSHTREFYYGVEAQPTLMSSNGIPQPDLEDQIATDQLLSRDHLPDDRQDLNLGLEDVGIVTVSEDGMQAHITLDHEEFARSHPNTTFHREPDVGMVQPFTIAGLKSRHITSIFHANRAPGTVLMTAPQTTVISQATATPAHIQNAVKYTDIDNMINSIPAHSNNINIPSVLVKDDRLTRFDSILTDTRELHLSNTASAIIHSSGHATQVIRRVCYDEDKRERDTRFLMDEPECLIAGNDAKMVAEDNSRDATLVSMTGDVDDRSSPERHAELFWESNSVSERYDGRRPLDFSSDSDKCCKSPSFDETNSTDSSGIGTHMRLDSVIKEARGIIDRSASGDGSSADDTHPPLRTYPPKRYPPADRQMERSLSGKTRAGERSPDNLEVRRRASGRGVVKRGCHCCNGSPAPPRPKKSRPRKPAIDFTANN